MLPVKEEVLMPPKKKQAEPETTTPATTKFLSIPQSTEVVPVSTATIKHYLSTGKLTRFKFGRRTFVSRDQLLSIVREA
jgi:hypothetical protein